MLRSPTRGSKLLSMSDRRNQSELPPAADILESLVLVPLGIFMGATTFPGFLLCVPGLAFVGAVAIVLVAAVTVVVVLAGAILATPYALVRLVRSAHRLRRRADRVATVRSAGVAVRGTLPV
jgi:hypothetical protein